MRMFLKIPEFSSGTYAPNDKRKDFPLDKFSKSLNADIDNLNELISEFNEAVTIEEKKELLLEIYHYHRNIISKYPDWVIATVPKISQHGFVSLLFADGFNEIKEQFLGLGLESIDSTSINKFDEEYQATDSDYALIKGMFFNYLDKTDLSSFPKSLSEILDRNYTFEINQLILSLANSPDRNEQYKQLIELKRIIRQDLATQDFSVSQKSLLREFLQVLNSGIDYLHHIDDVSLGRNLFGNTLISRLFANMLPEKVDQLTQILLTSPVDRGALEHLYTPGEDGADEYQVFLRDYSISFLGGTNTKNFRVQSLKGEEDFVLRVEKRMPAPMALADRLAASALKDVISPMEWRQITLTSPDLDNPITTYLVLTPFCEGGDLLTQRTILPDLTSENKKEIQTQAIRFYQEMAVIFDKMLEAGVAFTDPKNTNWLLHQKKLQLVDTKGFLPAPDGKLQWMGDERSWYPRHMVHSPHLLAPEIKPAFLAQKSIDVDKMHAYCLGINLYQFLKKCGDDYFLKDFGRRCVKNANELNFFDPIFKSPQGMHLKWLIWHLVKENPNDRISIKEAIERFEKIKELNLVAINSLSFNRTNCLELRRKIMDLRIDNEPSIGFLEETMEIIETATEAMPLIRFEKELSDRIIELIAHNKIKTLRLLENIEGYDLSAQDRAFTEQVRLKIEDTSTTPKEIKELHEQITTLLERVKERIYHEECSHCLRRCKYLLDELDHYHRIGNQQDIPMDHFIQENRAKLIPSRNNLKNLKEIQEGLETVYQSVTSVHMRAIRDVLDELRQNPSAKRTARVNRVEEILRTIAPHERHHAFFQPNLREALAYRHGPIKKGVPTNSDGSVKISDAAESFKQVYERIRKEAEDQLEPPSSKPSRPDSS